MLCPTAQLADQVSKERALVRFTQNVKILTSAAANRGNTARFAGARAAYRGGTPGRIREHLRKKTLLLDELEGAGAG